MRRDNRRTDASAAAAFGLASPRRISSSLLAPVDATSFTSAEVIGALETVRRALTSGEDILAFFDGWPGLERQTLVRRRICRPEGRELGGWRRRWSGGGSRCPEPADSQAVPPSAHPGAPAGSATNPEKAAGSTETGGPAGAPPEAWAAVGFLCRADERAYAMNIPSPDDWQYHSSLPKVIGPTTPLPPPSTPQITMEEWQQRIADELAVRLLDAVLATTGEKEISADDPQLCHMLSVMSSCRRFLLFLGSCCLKQPALAD